MNNQEFLTAIEKSFVEFIKSGTSRSTKKLVPLHSAIAKDILARLGGENNKYSVMGDIWRKKSTLRFSIMLVLLVELP